MVGPYLNLLMFLLGTGVSTAVFAEVPPIPKAPTEFWAGPNDPAGKVARRVGRLVPTFRNFRGEKIVATWEVDHSLVWKIPPEEHCLERLDFGVHFKRNGQSNSSDLLNRNLVATPILMGKIFEVDGVTFRSYKRVDWRKTREDIVLSCVMAEKLKVLSSIFLKYGIVEVGVMSHIRVKPRTSFHTMGLALDLAFFVTNEGEKLTVLEDFLKNSNKETCDGNYPLGKKERLMALLACELFESREFQTVITPNYNKGHRDHFHIDTRPDDPRFFLK